MKTNRWPGLFLFVAALLVANSTRAQLPGFTLVGQNWTYDPGDGGSNITGILLAPYTNGSLPAVIISHGKGGSAAGFSVPKARTMTNWGLVCIGPDYTHAGAGSTPENEGYSLENSRRARACVTILRALGYVDTNRLAAYGNSMGAFLTAGFGGEPASPLRAAAITAGGTSGTANSAFASPSVPEVNGLRAPFLMLHGTADTTVPPQQSANLQSVLNSNNVPNSRVLFADIGHDLNSNPATSNEVYALIREWFTDWGVLPALQPTLARQATNILVAWPCGAKDRFAVEHRPVLDTGAWQLLVTNWPSGASNRAQFLHTNALTNGAVYYRVIRSP